MCSNIFLLLAVYCVVVSGVKVDVHVKNVKSGYTTLQFTDGDAKTKAFSLGTADTGTNNIKIKTGEKIEETELELAFAPKAAAILPASGHSAIKVIKQEKTKCLSGDNCFEALAETYYLHVETVHDKHDKMTCGTVTFDLKHAGKSTGKEITVTDGVIHESALIIEPGIQDCKITATTPVASGNPADITILISSDECAQPKLCLRKNKATIKLHVSGVCKSQRQIIFTDTVRKLEKRFTLVEDGTTDDKIIKVTKQGDIIENSLPLTLEPTKCEVEGFSELPWIPIVESAECAIGSKNCFKNKAASNKSMKLVLLAVCSILGKMW